MPDGFIGGLCCLLHEIPQAVAPAASGSRPMFAGSDQQDAHEFFYMCLWVLGWYASCRQLRFQRQSAVSFASDSPSHLTVECLAIISSLPAMAIEDPTRSNVCIAAGLGVLVFWTHQAGGFFHLSLATRYMDQLHDELLIEHEADQPLSCDANLWMHSGRLLSPMVKEKWQCWWGNSKENFW